MDSLLLSVVLLFQFVFCYATDVGSIRPLVIWHGLGDSVFLSGSDPPLIIDGLLKEIPTHLQGCWNFSLW
jgi:hypothetical protein